MESSKTPSKLGEFIKIIKTLIGTVKLSLKAAPGVTIVYFSARLLESTTPIAKIWMGKIILDQVAAILQKNPNIELANIVNALLILLGIEVLSRVFTTTYGIKWQICRDV